MDAMTTTSDTPDDETLIEETIYNLARDVAITGTAGMPFWQREQIADLVIGTLALNPELVVKWADHMRHGGEDGYTPAEPPTRLHPYEPPSRASVGWVDASHRFTPPTSMDSSQNISTGTIVGTSLSDSVAKLEQTLRDAPERADPVGMGRHALRADGTGAVCRGHGEPV